MKRIDLSDTDREAQAVFNAMRQIVTGLRQASKSTERDLGLSSAQLFVLQKIADSDLPLSMNDLARVTFTHQSSVSVVVAKLAKRKLVVRARSKRDGRSIVVSLTEKGALLLSESPPLIQERLLKGITMMSTKDRRALLDGLNSLLVNSKLKSNMPSLFFEDEQKGIS